MKRAIFILVGTVAVLSVILAGCAPSETEEPSEADSDEVTKLEELTGDIECVAATGMAMYPEGGDATLFNPYFHYLHHASQTDPALKGRLALKTRLAGSLYNQNDAQTALAEGAIQLTYGGPHFFEQWHPAWKLLEAPGVIDDWDHFMRVMETDVWEELTEELASKGTTILTWIGNIGDVYAYTDEKIEGIDGMDGLKIRYFAGEAQATALKALGANAIFLPYTEVVTALETHQINGIWTDPPSALNFYHLYRYTPNVLPYPISIQPLCMTCNTEWLDSLPASGDPFNPGVREAFLRTFTRIETWRAGDYMADLGHEEFLAKEGTYSPPFDEAEFKRMQEIMVDAQQDMFAEIDPKYMEAIDSVRGDTSDWDPIPSIVR